MISSYHQKRFAKSSANTQRGYTLIELLVVMTIIGILASLVYTLPIGVRDSSLDQERADDVTSIARQLESSYDNQTIGAPAYPSTIELSASLTNRTDTLKGIEPDALKAPGATTSTSVQMATSTSTTTPISGSISGTIYVYQPFTRTGSLCNSAAPSIASLATTCVRFNIYYYAAVSKNVKKITSIRQQ